MSAEETMTAFAPFDVEKTSKLRYTGESKSRQIEIADGPSKVFFRRRRTPTPVEAPRNTPQRTPTPVEAPRNTPPPSAKDVDRRANPRIVVVAGPPSERKERGIPPGGPPRVSSQLSISRGVHQSRSSQKRQESLPALASLTKSVVLSRIGNLEKEQDLDNDLKRYWMPDKACKECSECQIKFNIIVRRHHCRICGRIFCNTCCSHTIPGVLLRPDLQGNLRVCKECQEIFQEFHTAKMKPEPNPNQSNGESQADGSLSPRSGNTPIKPLDPLQPPESPVIRAGSGNYTRSTLPMSVLSPHKSWDDGSSSRSQEIEQSPSRTNVEFDNPTPLHSRRQSSYDSLHLATERDERLLALEEDEVEYTIQEAWLRMTHPVMGLTPGNHRYRFRTFLNTYTAHDIVEWLIRNGYARSREVAVRVAQALVDTKRFKIVSSLDPTFRDESNLFLELGEAAKIELDPESPTVTDAPKWFQRLPENGDSEFEISSGALSNSTHLKFHYSQPPIVMSESMFMESRTFQEPTISDVAEKNDLPDSQTQRREQEDYLIIEQESRNFDLDNFTPRERKGAMLVPKGGPITGSSGQSPHNLSFFTLIDHQEVLKALPVGRLSAAAEAARDIAEREGGKCGVKSNEETRTHFEMEHDRHFDALMIQLIKTYGLPLAWLGVVKPLVVQASRKVKTNIFTDDVMNINHYVKIKKIPGGRKSDSLLVYGVVCSKNVTHKKMSHSIRSPTILLLKCAFEFQRRENQMSSLDTLHLQEEKYLKNLVARVKTFKPSVILVQKSVSRLALEMMYELGIVVAVNVKPTVMLRVARSTKGDLLHSLDQLFFDVRLGTCGHFFIRNFSLPDGMKKTLMYFDNCDPKLGCVITLQGGSNRELKKVKKLTRFGLHIAHNSHLEVSFLVDEFAWPATIQRKLMPDTEDYSPSLSTPEWPLYPSLAYPLEAISPTELAKKLFYLSPDDIPQAEEEPQEETQNYSNGLPVDGSTGETLSNIKQSHEQDVPLAASSDSKPAASNELIGEKEFQVALQNQILSISPNVHLPTPYLQTVQGMAADIRLYLPRVIYWSHHFRNKAASSSSSRNQGATSPLEMGITVKLVEENVEPHHAQPREKAPNPPVFAHSYKSVSDHPLTHSIFLFDASSDNMKAVLADYRARAGHAGEPNCFFFPSAKQASDYHFHLQNIFNKYRQFETESGSAKAAEEVGVAMETVQEVEEIKPVRRRAQRWKVPERDEHEISKERATSPIKRFIDDQKSSGQDKKVEGKETVEQESADECPRMSRNGMGKLRELSTGSKLSEKFGTLNDLDGDHAKVAHVEEEEEEGLEISTEDWNYGGVDSWNVPYQQVDCLDPCNHQGISILFSSTCHDGQKHQIPCVPPCIIPMNYYGRNDIALGEFLHRYCFREFYRCQTCSVDMTKHQRHVVHGNTALHISMQQLDTSIPGGDDSVFTWLACLHCAQCTPYLPLSEDSLQFSFAKFLELKFHCGQAYLTRYHDNGYTNCTHFLHGDYAQYFCHKNKIAAFQPTTIHILEVLIPPKTIVISTPHLDYHHDYPAEIRHISRITEGVFYRIKQRLLLYNMEPVAATVKDYVASCKAERDAFRNRVKHNKTLVVDCGFMNSGLDPDPSQLQMTREDQDKKLFSLQDGIADLKRALTEIAECWNIYLEGLDAAVRAYRTSLRRDLVVTPDNVSPADSPVASQEPDPTPTNSHSVTPRETPTLTPSPITTPPSITPPLTTPPPTTPPFTPPTSSPDYSLQSSHQTLSYSSYQTSSSTNLSGSGNQLLPPKQKHSRNKSDSDLRQVSAQNDPGTGTHWGHKRQLSDSLVRPVLYESPKADSSRVEEKEDESSSEAMSSETDLTTGHSSDLDGSRGISPRMPEGSTRATPTESQPHEDTNTPEKPEYHVIRSVVRHNGDMGRAFHGGHRSSHGSGEDSDAAVGIFAKLRGKDPETRDDPMKYYLLESVDLMHSPKLKPPASLEVPHHSRPYRRPGTIPRKTPAHTGISNTEAFGDGKRGHTVRERGFLARPFQKLPPPFELNEHHNMHKSVKIPIAVYEKEPTSIIAYALSSREYAQELKSLMERSAKEGASHAESKAAPPSPRLLRRQPADPDKLQLSTTSKVSTTSTIRAAIQELRKKSSVISLFSLSTTVTSDHSEPSDKSTEMGSSREASQAVVGPDVSQASGYDEDLDGFKWNLGPGSGNSSGFSKAGHISLEFMDKTASFFCKVYFAEEFYKIRELLFPSGEDRFVRSLARCVKFDAKGGKTRATFCKVVDDRFILKQIRSIELSSFEQFAPQYFEYVTRTMEEGVERLVIVVMYQFHGLVPARLHDNKRPLILAKILGVFSIGYRNTRTGNSKRLDVIIMENLLYGHTSSKVFDLKGSMRSRYIDPSKDGNSDVLLDENYLNFICNTPVYVHPHSKCVLMQAILADTEFLAKNSIMDYSLLTCIDEESGKLVVGIIDYVRTFTLDKRLEMYLKKTAGRVLPTVVYPELYRKRFCDAMERYFTVVPDKWTGLGADVKFFQ